MKNFLLIFGLLPLLCFGQQITISGHVTPSDPMAPRDSIPVFYVDSLSQWGPPSVTYTNSNGYYFVSFAKPAGPSNAHSFINVYIDSCLGIPHGPNTFVSHTYSLDSTISHTFSYDFFPNCNPSPNPSCAASFVVDTVNSFNGNVVLWNNSTASATAYYNWDFGDGTVSTNPFPSHTFLSAGIYQVCLTVIDSSCTSVYCDSLGMDANGNLIYRGQQSGFTLVVLDPNTFSADLIAPVKLSLYPNPATHSFQFDPELS
ncbi:MAG: PKD domain-containing protein, partial [Schleiferiaceae bacterium]|nr:PKD domain-containing protein [Schleiferiaceae bacterium]